MTRSRRRKHTKPSRRERALLAWLTSQMADPVAARLACHVTSMHGGLMAWIAAAEQARVLPGNALDGGSGFVTESRGPDDAMITLIDRRVFGEGGRDPEGADPERLDPVRQRLAHRLGDLAAWYGEGSQMLVTPEEWEPLAVRLGDFIGDQVAANALALCIVRHARMAYSPDEHWQRRRKNARDRWYRLAAWYVRVLDEQPSKGRTNPAGRPVIQSIEGEGERRFG